MIDLDIRLLFERLNESRVARGRPDATGIRDGDVLLGERPEWRGASGKRRDARRRARQQITSPDGITCRVGLEISVGHGHTSLDSLPHGAAASLFSLSKYGARAAGN